MDSETDGPGRTDRPGPRIVTGGVASLMGGVRSTLARWPFEWHGQWDAVVRSELGTGPAVSSDPEPLAVRWVR